MAKDIQSWNPEDEQEWAASGKSIATRNLWISIPSLLCGFAVWLYWGIITVQMLNLGFPYAKSELFSLAAIAGLSGATLRIPSTFFIRIAGGRNTIFFTKSDDDSDDRYPRSDVAFCHSVERTGYAATGDDHSNTEEDSSDDYG